MDFLPQVSSEYLDQRNFQSRNLAMQKYASQVELNLETNIDIGPVDSRARGTSAHQHIIQKGEFLPPPKCESTVRDLVQT